MLGFSLLFEGARGSVCWVILVGLSWRQFDPAPGPTLLPTGSRRFLETKRSRGGPRNDHAVRFAAAVPNYSELVGAAAAAAISTYSYHPESERGFETVVSVSGTGWDAVTYTIKEFWPDLRKRAEKKHSSAGTAGT